MGKTVSYEEYCERYALDEDSEDSELEYDEYCDNLKRFKNKKKSKGTQVVVLRVFRKLAK